MGQHVGTALARIVAEELEADWADIRINHVDTEAKYGLFVTGGSWSVWQNFDLLSRAGAPARLSKSKFCQTDQLPPVTNRPYFASVST